MTRFVTKHVPRFLLAVVALVLLEMGAISALAVEMKPTVNILFFGNSYTHRHEMPSVVEALAESAGSDRDVYVKYVTYGGKTMEFHWGCRSQDWIALSQLTVEGIAASREQALESIEGREPQVAPYNVTNIQNHFRNLEMAIKEKIQPEWDFVILQSYRDTEGGMDSSYAEFVPKFAKVIHESGATPVLYATTPTTQNAVPLTETPDKTPVLEETRFLIELAEQTDSLVVPMALVAHRVQTELPEQTLRYVNDGHLNQPMAYLTACTIHGVLFDESPVGLPVNEVTDNRSKNPAYPGRDADGGPLRFALSDELRLDLQRIAWEGLQEYEELSGE
jgi:hypothetical protein